MAKITIVINTDNAAFDYNLSQELSYVLDEVPSRVALHGGGDLHDSNGNTVGIVTVEGEE